MKKTCVLFFSLLLLNAAAMSSETDSLSVNKRALIIGADIAGPVINLINNSYNNYEGYIAYLKNPALSIVAETGYGSFNYSQYNYTYNCKGAFVRLGTDINLLKKQINAGNNFAGIGLRYGFSHFAQETPWFKYDNYWGTRESELAANNISAHFLQLSGGIKAEIVKNILIGWTIRMNLLVYNSGGKYNKPVYIPGMGETGGGLEPGVSFHIAWVMPLKKTS